MKLCSAGRQVQRRNGLHGNRVPVAHVVYALHALFKCTLYVQVDDGWSHKISWASYQCDGVETTVRIVRLHCQLLICGRCQICLASLHETLRPQCSPRLPSSKKYVTISKRVRLGLRSLPPAPLEDRAQEFPKGGFKMVPENFEAGLEQPSCLEAVGLQQAGR